MKNVSAMMILLASGYGCALPNDPKRELSKGNSAVTASQSSVEPQSQMPLPRDPQIAVQEEFDAALRQNSPAGWEMFLLRHPDNRLAKMARSNLNELAVKGTKSL